MTSAGILKFSITPVDIFSKWLKEDEEIYKEDPDMYDKFSVEIQPQYFADMHAYVGRMVSLPQSGLRIGSVHLRQQ